MGGGDLRRVSAPNRSSLLWAGVLSPGPAVPAPLLASKPQGSVASRIDQPLVGMVLAVAAGLFFGCSDALSKYLAPSLPTIQIVWMRWFGFLAIVIPTIIMSRGRVMRSRAMPIQIGRSLCLVGSSLFFVHGLGYLPLASATTLSFVSPMLVTALSIPLLGEVVRARRWAAIAVGMLGVLVVVRPGTGAFDPAAVWPMVSATCWALGVIATRRLAGVDPPWTAMCYSAVVGFAVLSVAVVPIFVMPTLAHVGIAALLAIAATAGQYLIVLAFQRAPASLLAPFTYLQLIWSTALGYLIFANLPDAWTWTGAAIIVGSGLYTAHRERVRLREEHARRLNPRGA